MGARVWALKRVYWSSKRSEHVTGLTPVFNLDVYKCSNNHPLRKIYREVIASHLLNIFIDKHGT